MRSFLYTLAAVPAVFAAPLQSRQDGDLIPERWLVQLNSDAVLSDVLASVAGIDGASTQHTYSFGGFKGFSMSAPESLLSTVTGLAAVQSVEQDSIVNINALTSQQSPPYGLARISHRNPGADEYIYDDSAGQGTYSYIIDTGVFAEHNDFDGRATFAMNFADDGVDTDCNGHGTHVSGTTGSTTYGVAKKTNIIGVKVLSCEGSGALSQVIAGIDYAVNDAKSKGRIGKAVGNLSLGGPPSPMTNAAVAEAVDQGLFLAVAAGNSGLPTITASPASEPSVCTVGAMDENDMRASFSNFGALVDVFAPGVDVLSTWIDGPDDTNIISGTSMASPHVCGLGAYLLGLEGARQPEALCSRIKSLSTKGKLGLTALSKDRIAYNGNGA